MFLVDDFDGTPPERNEDGPLRWVPVAEIGGLPMWEGDRHFLPLVFDDGPQFHAVIPYRDGSVVAGGVAVTRIP